MAQRDVAGAAGGGGEGDADEDGAHGVEAVGFGVEGDDALGGGVGDPFGEAGFGGDAFVGAEGGLFGQGLEGFGIGRGGLRAEFQAEAGGGALEAHGEEPGDEDGAVEFLGAEVFQGNGEGDVAGEFDELAADAGGVGVLDEHVAALAGLHGGGGGQDGLDGAVFLDELGGTSWGRCRGRRGRCRRCRPSGPGLRRPGWGARRTFSITSAGPMGFCLMGSCMVTRSSTSCIRSLSEETMVVRKPASVAARA